MVRLGPNPLRIALRCETCVRTLADPTETTMTTSSPCRDSLVLVLLVLVLAGAAHATATRAPLLEGLGPYRGPKASANPLAQRYFEQGVVMTWGFNAEEAARAFEAATRVDIRCALCWWGIAWSLGPNVNADMAPANATRIAAALAEARRLARGTRDRSLIAAMSTRHRQGVALDEQGYARRMEALARAQPDDADVAMLAAEALINLHPYDWWDARGQPNPWTPAILALLDRAIALEPLHAGAHHYRIHVLESSPYPERAQDSAARLTGLVPGSGHLLHMPAHIAMRTGRYDRAVEANQASIAADLRYLASLDSQRAYRVGYVAHNHHFLWAAAAMDGRFALALSAAEAAWPAACGPGRRDLGSGILQHYAVLPLFAKVRFGRWQSILTDTLPPDYAEPYPLGLWYYARGTAYAKTGHVRDAEAMLEKLDTLARDAAVARARIKNINPVQALMRIASLTLAADIAVAKGRPADAVPLLVEATSIEDGLDYDEPHLWLAPTRHALGAALLAVGRGADAERVYREDLAHYPENPWALAGLGAALIALGRTAEADDVERRRQQATARADVAIDRSRF
jgi:tetratricopeptide (TPR) repeat protein